MLRAARHVQRLTGMKNLCMAGGVALNCVCNGRIKRVLVQTARGIGDNGIWRTAKRNGILYLPDVGSKMTSFCFAFAGIFASN